MFDGTYLPSLHRPSVAPPFPLPVGASALWDSRVGITLGAVGRVQSWTDQIGSRVLSASSATARPAHGPDAGFFDGENVVQCNVANSRCIFGASLATLAAIGTFPFTFAVTRQRAKALTGIQVHFTMESINAPASNRWHFQLTARGNGAGVETWYCHKNCAGTPSDVVSGDIQDVLTHAWQYLANATTGFTPTMDRTAIGNLNNSNTQAAIAQPHITVGVGSDSTGVTAFGDVSVRLLMHSTQQPSAAELARMIEWACVWALMIG